MGKTRSSSVAKDLVATHRGARAQEVLYRERPSIRRQLRVAWLLRIAPTTPHLRQPRHPVAGASTPARGLEPKQLQLRPWARLEAKQHDGGDRTRERTRRGG